MGERLYHITQRMEWQAAQTQGVYRAPSLETQGFIHLSRAEQVAKVANAVYPGRTGLVVLEIDADRLTAEIRDEAADTTIPAEHATGELFPHLYGPLNIEAVIRAIDFSPGSDGLFMFSS